MWGASRYTTGAWLLRAASCMQEVFQRNSWLSGMATTGQLWGAYSPTQQFELSCRSIRRFTAVVISTRSARWPPKASPGGTARNGRPWATDFRACTSSRSRPGTTAAAPSSSPAGRRAPTSGMAQPGRSSARGLSRFLPSSCLTTGPEPPFTPAALGSANGTAWPGRLWAGRTAEACAPWRCSTTARARRSTSAGRSKQSAACQPRVWRAGTERLGPRSAIPVSTRMSTSSRSLRCSTWATTNRLNSARASNLQGARPARSVFPPSSAVVRARGSPAAPRNSPVGPKFTRRASSQ